MATVTTYWDAARVVFGSGMEPQSASVPCLVVDAADESAVRAALQTGLPSTYLDLALGEAEILERVGESKWRAEARYAEPDDPDALPSEYDFDTTGGLQHITTAISTVAIYGPKGSINDQGAIGFDGRNVNGADIIVPKFEWGETHYKYWVPASGEWAYQKLVRNLTGKVNNANFRGYDAGEVLFLGGRGRRTGGPYHYWRLEYRFAASENRTGLSVGDITGIAKKGWDLLDIRYEDRHAGDVDLIIPVPVAVLVRQVYRSGDFSTLGIGTSV